MRQGVRGVSKVSPKSVLQAIARLRSVSRGGKLSAKRASGPRQSPLPEKNPRRLGRQNKLDSSKSPRGRRSVSAAPFLWRTTVKARPNTSLEDASGEQE